MTTVQVPQSALEELLRRAIDVGGFPIAWLSFIDAGCERLRARAGVSFTELSAERSLALSRVPLDRALFVDDASLTEWRHHWLVAAGPTSMRAWRGSLRRP